MKSNTHKTLFITGLIFTQLSFANTRSELRRERFNRAQGIVIEEHKQIKALEPSQKELGFEIGFETAPSPELNEKYSVDTKMLSLGAKIKASNTQYLIPSLKVVKSSVKEDQAQEDLISRTSLGFGAKYLYLIPIGSNNFAFSTGAEALGLRTQGYLTTNSGVFSDEKETYTFSALVLAGLGYHSDTFFIDLSAKAGYAVSFFADKKAKVNNEETKWKKTYANGIVSALSITIGTMF